MKKNDKNISKSAANMMRNIDKKELESAAGGLIKKSPCLTCGLINVYV